MTNLFNQGRIDRVAEFIAAELRTLLDRRNMHAHMDRRLREDCPDYETLKNGEHVLATIKALNLVALDMVGDVASLQYDDGGLDEDDDGEAAA